MRRARDLADVAGRRFDVLVVDYLSRFTDWRPYEHRVLADLGGRQLPIPINRTTLNRLYDAGLEDEAAAEAFLVARAEPVDPVRTSEDVVVARVGRELYELFFRGCGWRCPARGRRRPNMTVNCDRRESASAPSAMARSAGAISNRSWPVPAGQARHGPYPHGARSVRPRGNLYPRRVGLFGSCSRARALPG